MHLRHLQIPPPCLQGVGQHTITSPERRPWSVEMLQIPVGVHSPVRHLIHFFFPRVRLNICTPYNRGTPVSMPASPTSPYAP